MSEQKQFDESISTLAVLKGSPCRLYEPLITADAPRERLEAEDWANRISSCTFMADNRILLFATPSWCTGKSP